VINTACHGSENGWRNFNGQMHYDIYNFFERVKERNKERKIKKAEEETENYELGEKDKNTGALRLFIA
jgi:hypothetical protein